MNEYRTMVGDLDQAGLDVLSWPAKWVDGVLAYVRRSPLCLKCLRRSTWKGLEASGGLCSACRRVWQKPARTKVLSQVPLDYFMRLRDYWAGGKRLDQLVPIAKRECPLAVGDAWDLVLVGMAIQRWEQAGVRQKAAAKARATRARKAGATPAA